MQGGGPALLIGAYAETLEFIRQQVLAGVLHRVLVRGRRAEPRARAAHAVRTGRTAPRQPGGARVLPRDRRGALRGSLPEPLQLAGDRRGPRRRDPPAAALERHPGDNWQERLRHRPPDPGRRVDGGFHGGAEHRQAARLHRLCHFTPRYACQGQDCPQDVATQHFRCAWHRGAENRTALRRARQQPQVRRGQLLRHAELRGHVQPVGPPASRRARKAEPLGHPRGRGCQGCRCFSACRPRPAESSADHAFSGADAPDSGSRPAGAGQVLPADDGAPLPLHHRPGATARWPHNAGATGGVNGGRGGSVSAAVRGSRHH